MYLFYLFIYLLSFFLNLYTLQMYHHMLYDWCKWWAIENSETIMSLSEN